MLVLWCAGLFVTSTLGCGCNQLWQRNPEDASVNIFINKSMSNQYELLTWQWVTKFKDGVWTVTVKRWPKLDFATGSLKFKNLLTNTDSHVGWKVKKNILSWSGKQGLIYEPAWNMSVCNFNMDWGFKPERYGRWIFRIGNATMLEEVGSCQVEENIKMKCFKKRSKRSPDDEEEAPPLDDAEEIPTEDGAKRKSFIKWILRKTGLEQGDDDQRNWWERIADLIVSWFRVVFA